MSVLADHRVPADRLITILSGRVSLSAPAPKNEPPGRRPILSILFSGDGIGDMSVLGDRRWAGSYGIDADFIALENTHVAFVETKEIQDALRTYPSLRRVRRYFQAIAYRPLLKEDEPQPQERPTLENLEKHARKLKAIYDWIDLARRLLAVDAKSRQAAPFSFPIPLDGAVSSAFARPTASAEALRDPAAPKLGGSGGYGWSMFSSGFSSTFVSRNGSTEWVSGSPRRNGRLRIGGDGDGNGRGGGCGGATSEAGITLVTSSGSASMASATRPSALTAVGAGAASLGAWETAGQVLAPHRTVAAPQITSVTSDFSGSGDGGHGADRARSRSIERRPSDAGSGGGFSASSAGDHSATGSTGLVTGASQRWMKAAASAAARIGQRTPVVVSPAIPVRLRKMGSTTIPTARGGSSADHQHDGMVPISRTRSWNGSPASPATSQPRRVPSFRPLKAQSKLRP